MGVWSSKKKKAPFFFFHNHGETKKDCTTAISLSEFSMASDESSSSSLGIDWGSWVSGYTALGSLDTVIFVVVFVRFVHLLVLSRRMKRSGTSEGAISADIAPKVVFFGSVTAAALSGVVNYFCLVATSRRHILYEQGDPRSDVIVFTKNLAELLSLLMNVCVLVLWMKLVSLFHRTQRGGRGDEDEARLAPGNACLRCCCRAPVALSAAAGGACYAVMGVAAAVWLACTALWLWGARAVPPATALGVLSAVLSSCFVLCGAALLAAGVLLTCLLWQTQLREQATQRAMIPALALPAAALLVARGAVGLAHRARGYTRYADGAWSFVGTALGVETLPTLLLVVLMWPLSQRADDESHRLLDSDAPRPPARGTDAGLLPDVPSSFSASGGYSSTASENLGQALDRYHKGAHVSKVSSSS